MKFLNISDIKLKATLSSADCREYGIDNTKGDYSTREVRQAVRRILELAESECGFSTYGDKILVQLYPLPNGDCELLITRLTALSRKERVQLEASDGLSLMEKKRGVYRFHSSEELKSAIRAVYRDGVIADLYRDDLGRYYISIEEEITDGISEFEIFVEYGERLNTLPIAVISEYGSLLVKSTAFDYILSDNLE